MTRGKHPVYDDKFRASACVMLEAAGYPARKGALHHVAGHLGIHDRTLSRWFKGESNPPPDRVVNKIQFDMRDLLREELQAALLAMGAAREDATYRDLGVVVGILSDKLNVLENRPTERIEHTGTVTVEERISRVAVLLDTARTRGIGQLTSGIDD